MRVIGIILYLIAALLLILVFTMLLVLFLPVRVRLCWHDMPQAWAGLGPVMLKIYPPKPRKKPKKPEKPRSDKKPSPQKNAQPKKTQFQLAKLTPSLLLEYARLGKQTLGRMFGALKISSLQLHAVVAASDPGCAALAYGAATAAISTLASMLENNIKWRSTDVFVEIDFEGKSLLSVDVTIRATTAIFVFATLRAYRSFKRINAAALESENKDEALAMQSKNGQ